MWILLVGLAFWLGPVRRVEPFFTYFYFFAWGPFLWFLIRRLRRFRPEHPLLRRSHLLPLFGFSVTVWLLFEVFNFRLGNWTYHGLPPWRAIRWPGYALAFSTVVPAVLVLAALFHPAVYARPPSRPEPRSGAAFFVTGALMLILPLAWPRYFFPLIWGAAFFLAEPLVERWGGHSLAADWRNGNFRTTKALLAAGFICGGYWELCNFWAGAKWMYHIPFVGALKVFEMPVLGFLGFPAFALEIYALVQLRDAWARRPGRLSLLVGRALTILFWIAAFAGIDRWTVQIP